MKKQLTGLFILLSIIAFIQLEALNRDYHFDYVSENDFSYAIYFKPRCLRHTPYDVSKEFQSDLLGLIPTTGKKCATAGCKYPSIYFDYFDPDFKKYQSHLIRQLEYSRDHSECNCLWPESAEQAAQISDDAYYLFRDLLSSTSLSKSKWILYDRFFNSDISYLRDHGQILSFIVHQFRFSDYYKICRDIENFAICTFEEKDAACIKDKLQDILEALYPKFFLLYSSCHPKHPNPEIKQEIRFMKLLIKDISVFAKNSHSIIFESKNLQDPLIDEVTEFNITNELSSNVTNEMDNICGYSCVQSVECFNSNNYCFSTSSFSLESDIYLEHGTFLNELLLYNEAILILTKAIQINPNNRDAFIERAMAYFETNQLTLAMRDYLSAKKLTIVPPLKLESSIALGMAAFYIPEDKLEFSKGLVSGTVDGGKVSLVEFIPSIFSCCRGILNGLWAFACSPMDVSAELVNTAYSIGEFVSNNSTEECFQFVVPELKELSISWSNLNDYTRGQKIGFIIGKYGVEIFAPAGAFKGLNKVRALKRANTMNTLECCVASKAKQAIIFEESLKRATKREKLVVDSIKKNKILVRNSNTQIHIIQPKHAWDKLVKMNGNIEEDCQKVVNLLENNQIMLEKYRLRPEETFEKFARYNHKMTINGYEVRAIFNKNLETGEMFLNDAWVVTK